MDFLFRMKVYLLDLLNYKQDKCAQARLDSSVSTNLPGLSYYFSEEEISNILVLVEQKFQQVLKKKRVINDWEIYTSHDLAPIIQEVFNIPKGFQKDKAFLKARKRFLK